MDYEKARKKVKLLQCKQRIEFLLISLAAERFIKYNVNELKIKVVIIVSETKNLKQNYLLSIMHPSCGTAKSKVHEGRKFVDYSSSSVIISHVYE